jgi:glutamate/tyrosine decarboxylase-like PLP-dependent enzyme
MTDYYDGPRREAPLDLASVFLGPKGENADVFEKLLLEAYRDHVFWRRNYHPEDGFQVGEAEKRAPGFDRAISQLSQELMELLGELKAGVPFASPRYIGHMSSDLTMASMIGYFATMLYNPNNVAAESSPVTTRLELEVAAQLAQMIGYDPVRQWGHLTSGGTVANLEALWVARNVKYLPIAVRWAAEELGVGALPVALPDGSREALAELDLWQLLNVAPGAALDLSARLAEAAGDTQRANRAILDHSIGELGYQEFRRRVAVEHGDALPSAVVLVPSTAHYSWDKVCRALGIGGRQLVHVPVDGRFRMDPAALEARLRDLREARQPVICLVSVMGSTEESAVDRLDLIADLREKAGRELGMATYLHADAAWGGYAAAITRGADGRRRSFEATLADYAPEAWPSEGVYRGLVAMERADSVTIDPHKLGFVPYPAGAVCFRDPRVRSLVAVEAPVLFHDPAADQRYIGRFILEGSKPGAAAAGVWMSHKVLPLDSRGYGRLIGETVRGALALHRRLSSGDWSPFRVVPLPAPDLNVVCFAVGHPALNTLEATNAFAGRIYRAMSVSGGKLARQVEYFVTMTELRDAEYGDAAVPLARALGFTRDDYLRAGGVNVIRCTVMDPFLASRRGRVDFIGGFARALHRVLEAALEELMDLQRRAEAGL